MNRLKAGSLFSVGLLIAGVAPSAAKGNSEARTALAYSYISDVEARALGMEVQLRKRVLGEAKTIKHHIRSTVAALDKISPEQNISINKNLLLIMQTRFHSAQISSGLTKVQSALDWARGEMLGIKKHAASLREEYKANVPRRSSSTDPVEDLENVLEDAFRTIDEITETEVIEDEVIPYEELQGVLEEATAEAHRRKESVYEAIPGSGIDTLLRNTESDINAVAGDVEDFLNEELLDLPSLVEDTVESLMPEFPSGVPGGGGRCDVDSQWRTYIHYGNDQANSCVGHDGPDVFYMEASADTVFARAGADVIHLGSGADQGHGETGGDEIYGATGQDDMWGGTGNDWLYDSHGNGDHDHVYGGPGFDDGDIDDGDYADTWRGGQGSDGMPEFDSELFCGDSCRMDDVRRD